MPRFAAVAERERLHLVLEDVGESEQAVGTREDVAEGEDGGAFLLDAVVC